MNTQTQMWPDEPTEDDAPAPETDTVRTERVRLPGTPEDGWPCGGGCGRSSWYTAAGVGYRCWVCR